MVQQKKVRVLFVCLGNACRSVMAEAIARHMAGDILEASSAGLIPLGYVPDTTERTLANNGYPAAGLSSKPLRQCDLDEVDMVVNLSGEPKEQVFDDPAKVEDWKVEDPYGEDREVYQRILEDIEQRVTQLSARLRAQQSHI